MTRKRVARTVLSPEQSQILKAIAQRFGTSESEILRTALMDYAKAIGALNFERR